jgi:hypothetical protein
MRGGEGRPRGAARGGAGGSGKRAGSAGGGLARARERVHPRLALERETCCPSCLLLPFESLHGSLALPAWKKVGGGAKGVLSGFLGTARGARARSGRVVGSARSSPSSCCLASLSFVLASSLRSSGFSLSLRERPVVEVSLSGVFSLESLFGAVVGGGGDSGAVGNSVSLSRGGLVLGARAGKGRPARARARARDAPRTEM